jgi:NitT/TauT family transport system permease protein
MLGIPPLLLPGPITVLQSAMANEDVLLQATAYTMLEVLLATIIATTAGFATAVLIAMVPALRRMIFPYILMTQVVPKVALAPILIAWFGIGMQSRLVLAFLIAYFPMVINSLTGILGTGELSLQYARSLAASELQVLSKVRLPAALPAIMGGVKITAGVAVIGIIVGEFVASDEGLGKIIIESLASLDTSLTVAATLAVGCLGLLLLAVLEVIDNRVVYWRAGQ